MSTIIPISEGYVQFQEYKTWYCIVGDLANTLPGKFPVLMLHGGPGIPHDRLEPLKALAKTGRPVVFYDQLGCGNSDSPDNPSLWSLELFLDELATVRRSLVLDQIHLFGHSWGGMLAMEYALLQPDGILSLTLASSPANIPLWKTETKRLREELPPEVQETLLLHEAGGTTDDPAYSETMMFFYDRVMFFGYVPGLSLLSVGWRKRVSRYMRRCSVQARPTLSVTSRTGISHRVLASSAFRASSLRVAMTSLLLSRQQLSVTLSQIVLGFCSRKVRICHTLRRQSIIWKFSTTI